jgi:hypothetical protein
LNVYDVDADNPVTDIGLLEPVAEFEPLDVQTT